MAFFRQRIALTPELKEKVQQFTAIQKELQTRLIARQLPSPLKYVAGCDSAFIGDHILSVFVLFSFPDLVELEVVYEYSEAPVEVPYIPGFLSFREIPNLLKAYEKLQQKPDVIMVDGQGILHPRRMGIGAHLGVLLGLPTIGVAKSKLFGKYLEPATSQGSISPIVDSYHPDQQLGVVLRSKERVKPLYVSPGHLCTIEDALWLTQQTLRKHKLPEPTRFADFYSKSLKSEVLTKVV